MDKDSILSAARSTVSRDAAVAYAAALTIGVLVFEYRTSLLTGDLLFLALIHYISSIFIAAGLGYVLGKRFIPKVDPYNIPVVPALIVTGALFGAALVFGITTVCVQIASGETVHDPGNTVLLAAFYLPLLFVWVSWPGLLPATVIATIALRGRYADPLAGSAA